MPSEIFYIPNRKNLELRPHVRCSVDGCCEAVPLIRIKRGNAAKCSLHARMTFVAGRKTKSQALIRDADIIVGWRAVRNGAAHRPLASCTIKGCRGTLCWSANWKPEWRQNRKCRECLIKHGRLRPYEGPYKCLLASAGQGQKRVNLTLSEFGKLCEIPNCFYCGDALERRKLRLNSTARSQAYFLDRIDDDRPYELGNVVPCCTSCNFTKNIMLSFEEMAVVGALRSQNTRSLDALIAAALEASPKWSIRIKEMRHLRLLRRSEGRKLVAPAIGEILNLHGYKAPVVFAPKQKKRKKNDGCTKRKFVEKP